LAGALILISLAAISGGMGSASVAHKAYFKYAGGIQPGAAVRSGGLSAGKVNRVRIDPGNSTRIEIDFLIDQATFVKTDSIAKITTLGALTDNYVEITTGTESSAPLPPGAPIGSTEMFGLPQLGDAVQAMLPDVQRTLLKVDNNPDGLEVTLARANDLLNDQNRATIAHTLSNADQLLAETRPKVNESLDKVNRLLTDAQPKVSASLANIQELTAKMTPLLEDVKKVSTRASDVLAHVDETVVENRSGVRASVTGVRDALANSAQLLDHLNQALDQNSDNIDELLDNIRISTENLKGLTETLRSSPASLIRGIRVDERVPEGRK
jgi:phospholipid/cholesterol/gamma-HCH transport system substrate-binding protein